MALQAQPSYAELVYDALRSADHPLTFGEIFESVSQRRPITTKNPKATIRHVLSQGTQLISLGDGHYGYLPHLVDGSLLRVLLTEKKPANHPLIFSDEVRQALWPSFFESQKRRFTRPFQVALPEGGAAELQLEFLGTGIWGSSLPEALRQYLVKNRASSGDSLVIRVTDGDAGRGELYYEPRRKRDTDAVRRRNQEVADAAYQILQHDRSPDTPIWDLAIALLGRGIYRSDVAPDPLETVLKADQRFVAAGLHMWMLEENLTPEYAETIRGRKAIEGLMLEPPDDLLAGPGEILSSDGVRRAMEKSLADVTALLSQQNFGSLEDANAFLENLLASGPLPPHQPETPLEQAQDLMYEAWESSQSADRIRLARKALQISPDCADAYVLLAEETARTAREAAELYAKGVAAGERALGKDVFDEDVGHFWLIVETRPYMRARLGLAFATWETGKHSEAIEILWDMLRLNPGDNQGVRYVLLAWLFEVGNEAQVQRLLDLYPDEGSAVWLYGRALHAFREGGDSPRSRELLAEATEENPHVPSYLLGKKRLPRRSPQYVGIGDENEAIDCAVGQLAAWRATPGAIAWLGEHAG